MPPDNKVIEKLSGALKSLADSAGEFAAEEKQKEFEGFYKLFNRFYNQQGKSIDWDRIEKLPNDAIINYNRLTEPDEDAHIDLLKKLVIIKLNGGLGTSMGCKGPKSIIPVKDGKTFLDLTIEQVKHLNKTYETRIPLILMNSFNTDDATERLMENFRSSNMLLYSFNQSCYPRIAKDDYMPIPRRASIRDQLEAWYPPGHGDFYTSFFESGLLERFLREGREYCFISNIDNLGAVVDLKILNLILNNSNNSCGTVEFIMEVTDKTRADVKGGTLIQYEGKVGLLEIAQVPDEHVNDFKSIKHFKYFNTNNIWISLKAIDRLVRCDKLQLDVIVNHKTLSNGQKIIQLETAIGAGMKYFNKSIGVNVPRYRFAPVKKTSDLVLIMSNLYELQNGALIVSPARLFPSIPNISLDDKYFKNVDSCLRRFHDSPDFLELDNLTVSGDVSFGKNVSVRGTVIVVANDGCKIEIPEGTILENKIVTGDLRIRDY